MTNRFYLPSHQSVNFKHLLTLLLYCPCLYYSIFPQYVVCFSKSNMCRFFLSCVYIHCVCIGCRSSYIFLYQEGRVVITLTSLTSPLFWACLKPYFRLNTNIPFESWPIYIVYKKCIIQCIVTGFKQIFMTLFQSLCDLDPDTILNDIIKTFLV